MDTVRLANAMDAPAITQLQLSNWQLSHAELAQTLVSEDVEFAWAQAITIHTDLGRVLICERDGTLVGVAAVEFWGKSARFPSSRLSPRYVDSSLVLVC